MNFVTISIKCVLPETPVLLTKDSEDELILKKADREVRLNTLDTEAYDILPDIGSSFGNVIFILNSEFQIDPLLEGKSEKGVFEFKEAERSTKVDVTKTILENQEVLSYHFEDMNTARRFIDKKIFGEIYLLKFVDDRLIFYPQLKEVYLSSSSSIEVGCLGLLDCENILSSSSATITELPLEPTDKKTYKIEDMEAVIEFPIWKKYRLDFNPGSGTHIIRMIRGKGEVKDQAGNKYWAPQDEILKIHICEG